MAAASGLFYCRGHMENADESDVRRVDGQFAAVNARMDARFEAMQEQIDRRFEGMHNALDESRDKVEQVDERVCRIETNTSTLISIFNRTERSASYFARMATFLRRAAIFVAPFVTLGGFIWAVLHGKPPAGE